MDIKVYRFINSHAMTQIIFLSKTFCNDFIKYIFNNINSNHEKYFHFTPNRNPFVQHAPIGIRLTSIPKRSGPSGELHTLWHGLPLHGHCPPMWRSA